MCARVYSSHLSPRTGATRGGARFPSIKVVSSKCEMIAYGAESSPLLAASVAVAPSAAIVVVVGAGGRTLL